jgi:hypothetical protein
VQVRILRDQAIGVTPVGGDAFSVEQSGGGQEKDTGTDGYQPGATGMSAALGPKQGGRRRLIQPPPPRNHNGSGALQGPQPAPHIYANPTGRVNWGGVSRANFEVVPRHAQSGSSQPE